MYRAMWIELDVEGTILLLHVVLNNVFLKLFSVSYLKVYYFLKKVSEVAHIRFSSSRNSEMLVMNHTSNLARDCLIQE